MSEIGTDKNNLVEKTVKKYSNLIFLTAYQSLANYHDAEDIMQEVAVALVTSDPPFDDETHLRNWLVKVTLNKCSNFKKYRKRRACEPIDNYINLQAPKAREALEELWQLPDNYRNIIYLYYYQGFSIAEIAEILRKNINTVGSQLRRARKMLKKLLKEGE